jgi:hypothetical protein
MLAHANLIVHPTGRNCLQLAEHVSQPVRRAKAGQQMYMIRNATDALGTSTRGANDSA